MKKLLDFGKFPERAMGQVREVIEADMEFRNRVVGAVDEEAVGRIGWLWLARPDGWAEECAELAATAEQELEAEADVQSQQVLEQRLHRAEAALKKAERQRDKAGREREQARLLAAQARSEARQIEEESGRLAAEQEKTLEELNSAQKSLERMQRKEVRTDDKLKKAQREIDRLNKELRDSRTQHEEEVNSLTQRLVTAEEEVAMAQEAGFEPPEKTEPESPNPINSQRPIPLPPGMLRETVEAAEHLLRTPKVVMLVDGYNVTFKNWQDQPVREQRVRLIQKLNELSARYSEAEIVVVFDGSETDYDYIPTTPRSLGVTVRFSPLGTEADDVIIKWCRDYPLSQPLVVVSHDGRVRECARNLKANVVQPSKLLKLMGVEVEVDDDSFGFLSR